MLGYLRVDSVRKSSGSLDKTNPLKPYQVEQRMYPFGIQMFHSWCLKNMRKSNWIISPKIRGETKNVWNDYLYVRIVWTSLYFHQFSHCTNICTADPQCHGLPAQIISCNRTFATTKLDGRVHSLKRTANLPLQMVVSKFGISIFHKSIFRGEVLVSGRVRLEKSGQLKHPPTLQVQELTHVNTRHIFHPFPSFQAEFFFVPQEVRTFPPIKPSRPEDLGACRVVWGLTFLSFPLPHFLNVKHLMLHGGISCVVWLEYFTNKERGLIKIPKLRSWFALVEVVKNLLCLKSSSNTKTTQWYKSSPFSHPKNTTTQQSNFN